MSKGLLKKRIEKLDLSVVPIQDTMVLQRDSLYEVIDSAKKDLLEKAISIELKAQPILLPSGYTAKHEKLIAIPISDWKKWFGDSS